MALTIAIGPDGGLTELPPEELEMESRAKDLTDLSDAAARDGTVCELSRILARQAAAKYAVLAECARERRDGPRELAMRRVLDRMNARAIRSTGCK